MRQVFISFVEEDLSIAESITRRLESAGVATWRYDRDTIPGPSYLEQVIAAIDVSAVVIVLVSPTSLGSHQVGREIERAHELRKKLLPVLFGVTQRQLESQQPGWKLAFGTATTIRIGSTPDERILDRISSGVRWLLDRDAVSPTSPAEIPIADLAEPKLKPLSPPAPPPPPQPAPLPTPPAPNPPRTEPRIEPAQASPIESEEDWDTWYLRILLLSSIKTRTQRILRGITFLWAFLFVVFVVLLVIATELYLDELMEELATGWPLLVAMLATVGSLGWLALRLGSQGPRWARCSRIVKGFRRFLGPEPQTPGSWIRTLCAALWLSLGAPAAAVMWILVHSEEVEILAVLPWAGVWIAGALAIWIWHSPRWPSRALAIPAAVLAISFAIVAFHFETVTGQQTFGWPFSTDQSTTTHGVPRSTVFAAARLALATHGVVVTQYEGNYGASISGRLESCPVWISIYAYTTNSSNVTVQSRTPWGFGNLHAVDLLQREIAKSLKGP